MGRHTLLYIIALLGVLLNTACSQKQNSGRDDDMLVVANQGYPQAASYNGLYYYTMQSVGGFSLEIYATADLQQLEQARRRTIIEQNDTLTHIWSPELHRIGNKWYLYFEGDDGNTDNHHLFVMECDTDDPMTGTFVLKGAIDTHAEWNYGIHPNVLQLPDGNLYLLWSGWPKRRAETETQCIYIAHMSDPWTLDSERTMISKPDYEWERQWINPDGDRSAYPIYVNENPEAFLSPDGQRVVVLYSASGIWTVYTSMGMLSAPSGSNLLDSAVWTKSPEPVLSPDTLSTVCFTNAYLLPAPDGQRTLMLYEHKWREDGNICREIFVRPVSWTPDGVPQLQ